MNNPNLKLKEEMTLSDKFSELRKTLEKCITEAEPSNEQSTDIKLQELSKKLSASGMLTAGLVMNKNDVKQMIEDEERRIRDENCIMNQKQEVMSLEEFSKAVDGMNPEDEFSIDAIQNKASEYKKELDTLENELERISAKFGFSKGTILFDLKSRML